MADTIIERAVDAAWTELERQAEVGKPGPWVDRDELSVIDGEVDMPALVRAILIAIRQDAERRQEGVDWAAEYGESAEAAVVASDLASLVRYVDAALAEEG